MVDPKNHSFTSSFKIRKAFGSLLIFLCPVIILMLSIEIYLRNIPSPTNVKIEYINKKKTKIKVLFLGSSQMERAINPEYIDYSSINLANSAQTLNENLTLLKHFQEKMPELRVVVLELLFNISHLDDSYSPLSLNHLNWVDYKVNTFGRNIKPQDYLLYYTNPKYFTDLIKYEINKNSPIKLNRYGFDINKYDGSFKVANYNSELILDKDIYIENKIDAISFKKNTLILNEFIRFCKEKNLKLVIYGTPSHYRYNELRNQEMLDIHLHFLSKLKIQYPEVKFFLEEENQDFKFQDFYNANHLNPKGAKKASLKMNEYLYSLEF